MQVVGVGVLALKKCKLALCLPQLLPHNIQLLECRLGVQTVPSKLGQSIILVEIGLMQHIADDRIFELVIMLFPQQLLRKFVLPHRVCLVPVIV